MQGPDYEPMTGKPARKSNKWVLGKRYPRANRGLATDFCAGRDDSCAQCCGSLCERGEAWKTKADLMHLCEELHIVHHAKGEKEIAGMLD